MADTVIQDVADTAFLMAGYRARESQRPDALFHDPLAGKLAGDEGRDLVRSLAGTSGLREWMVLIRTCIIDEFIQRSVAEGVDTVLNLGAGLDTRPYRMNLPSSLRWVEVDCPRVIDLKESRLAAEEPRCRLQRLKMDLTDVLSRRQFLATAVADTGKVLVLTEGVVLYLSVGEAGSLAHDLRTLPTVRYWISDYVAPVLHQYRRREVTKNSMKNAPFRFEPADYFGFFREHGWRPKEIRYIAAEGERLNRPQPSPRSATMSSRLREFFISRGRREARGKSAAYVLFEPASGG
jgi:methyltransferase (TIGR00027 family)